MSKSKKSIYVTGVSYGVRFLVPNGNPRKFRWVDSVRGAALIHQLLSNVLPEYSLNPISKSLPLIREYKLKWGEPVLHGKTCDFSPKKRISKSALRIGEKIEIESKNVPAKSLTEIDSPDVWVHYANLGGFQHVQTNEANVKAWAKQNILLVKSLKDSEKFRPATWPKTKKQLENVVFVVDVKDLAGETKIRLASSMEALCVDVLHLIRDLETENSGIFRFLKGLPQNNAQPKEDGHAKGNANVHILVRIEREACLWIQPLSSNKNVELLWHKCRNPRWSKESLGGLVGRSSLLAACLALSCARDLSSSGIRNGIKIFLNASHDWFASGYDKDTPLLESLEKSLRKDWSEGWVHDPYGITLDWNEVTEYKRRWRITERWLAERYNKKSPKDYGASDLFRRAGMEILTLEDPSKLGTTPSTIATEMPNITIGHLKLVDRLEIEDYLAVRNALLEYAAGQTRKEKPLNLAVFGPPGDGKSSGIKALIKDLGNSQDIFRNDPLEFNMSQFTSLSELWEALHECRNKSMDGKFPIALIDEFDATFDNQPFGWLKYFLAPMQDGMFFSGGKPYNLGKMVFVFAGGINRSMDEFNSRIRSNEFCSAKGPDFISRLRGVLNVRGISKTEDLQDAGIYVLRRAIKLESILMRMHEDRGIKSLSQPLMTLPLARAFLSVDTFKHGIRSMEAILRMSHFVPGETMKPSDLPVKEQLGLHVDWREFFHTLEEKSAK